MSQAYDTNGAIKITGAGGGGGADGINRISAGTQIAGTSTTVVFSNSNNVSFGMSASSIVTASASFAQSTQPVAASAANGSVLFSTLSFSNANGITFSTGAGPAIIGSVATTYRASNDAVGLNTAQSNVTWTVNSAGLSLDARGYAGTGTSATNASITLNSNGLAISVAAPGGGGAVNFSAGTTSNNLQSVVFSNSNGVSFGLNGSTITASHNGLTSQSNQAWSGSNASSTFQTLSFNNANGVSWSNNAGAVEASYTRPVVSNAIQSVGSATNSGTNTSRFAADDHVHAGVFSMGVTNAGNSVGDTRVDVGRFVLQGGNSITLSQITAANALNTIVFSGPNALTSQSNQAFSAAGGSSAFQTLGFSDGNGVSFTNTNGSVGATVRTNYASSVHGHTMTASAVSNTTQSSSGTLDMGGFNVAGAGAISVGISNNSIVISGPSGGGETRLTAYAQSNTTQSSSGTIALSSLNFHGAGIASVGVSNGSVIVSVPSGGGAGDGGVFAGVSTGGNTAGSTGTVSTGNFVLVGSNDITLSQSTGAAGSAATISIIPPGNLSGWLPYQNAVQALLADSNQSLLLAPHVVDKAVQYDRLVFPIYYSQATNSTLTVSRSVYWGLFTKNGSSLSLHYSGSGSYSINGSGTASSSANSGVRIVSFGQTTTLTQGNYVLGVVFRSSTAGANATVSIMARSEFNSSISGYIGSGSVTNLPLYPGLGVWTSTTSGIPNSLAYTDIRANSSAFQRPPIVIFTSGTN